MQYERENKENRSNNEIKQNKENYTERREIKIIIKKVKYKMQVLQEDSEVNFISVVGVSLLISL